MGVDVDLWTREDRDLARLLPRAEEWESFGDEFQFDGDGWLVSVFAPEPLDSEEVPPEVADLVDGLAYRVGLAVEPSGAPAEAWKFLEQVLISVGRGLGGAGLHPETGAPTSWVERPP